MMSSKEEIKQQQIIELEADIKSIYHLIADLEISESHQGIILEEGLTRLRGTTIVEPSGSINPGANLPSTKHTSNSKTVEGPFKQNISDTLERLSQETNTDKSALEELLHLDDGYLQISVPAINLGETNIDQIRALSLILSVANKFCGSSDELALEYLRDEAKRLKCYDRSNFVSQVKDTDGITLVGQGKARRIQVKTSAGATFRDLIQRLGESL